MRTSFERQVCQDDKAPLLLPYESSHSGQLSMDFVLMLAIRRSRPRRACISSGYKDSTTESASKASRSISLENPVSSFGTRRRLWFCSMMQNRTKVPRSSFSALEFSSYRIWPLHAAQDHDATLSASFFLSQSCGLQDKVLLHI